MKPFGDLAPPPRCIMTPGPVEVDPRVLRAMSFPVLGQFDPEFTGIMNEVMEMLRLLFSTNNQWAFPVDGTSRAGIEAVMVSLISPGDRVLIPVYGRFGSLLHEIAERCGAEVHVIEKPWGSVFAPEEIITAIHRVQPHAVVMVHGETSTGRLQPLEGIGEACRAGDALLIVDAVATIGGVPVETDKWKLDAVIGGTQKCLSIPAGMAPITYNERAEKKLASRKRIERGLWNGTEEAAAAVAAQVTAVRSNYFDLSMLQDYWSPLRLNHHTEMTSMLYALREGLRLVLQEGLEARLSRHLLHEQALVSGIEAMGLSLYGEKESKLPMVTCVAIPKDVDGETVRKLLLQRFGVEIASSFGPLHGKIWRIGTMGYSCRTDNVLRLLGALEAVLLHQGCKISAGHAVNAALKVYEQQP